MWAISTGHFWSAWARLLASYAPRYEREYLSKSDGEYEIGESYVTVSLYEPHNDACYKLVAAIMERVRS